MNPKTVLQTPFPKACLSKSTSSAHPLQPPPSPTLPSPRSGLLTPRLQQCHHIDQSLRITSVHLTTEVHTTACFLPTNAANRGAHFKQSTQQATLVKWYHLCFPSLQGGRNRIGFGFDSRTSHIHLFIFAPLYFLNLLSFHAKILSLLAVGRHCSQKHSLVRTEVTFCTCDFGFIKEHLRAKRERSCQQQCLANAYRYFYGSPDRVSKNNTIYSDNAMQQPSVPVKTKRSARRQPPPGYHMLAAPPLIPRPKYTASAKAAHVAGFFPSLALAHPQWGGHPFPAIIYVCSAVW